MRYYESVSEPENQCPHIDDILKSAECIRKIIWDKLSKASDPALIECIEDIQTDIEMDLNNIESVTEDRRGAFSDMREWGKDNEEKVEDFKKEISDLVYEKEKLEKEIENLRDEVKSYSESVA